MLRPQLITMYLNDLNNGIECNVFKTIDDVKICDKVICKKVVRVEIYFHTTQKQCCNLSGTDFHSIPRP